MPEKNNAFLCGKVVSIEESHHTAGDQFFRFMLDIPRLSGNVDSLPLIVSEKLLYNNEIVVGDYVKVNGQIRTKNKLEEGKNRLLVFAYAFDITKISEEEFDSTEEKNRVELNGFICKKPNYRETATGRKISDMLIAFNRNHNQSDYIPSIAWGINAAMAKNFEVGESVKSTGRFQSRTYIKRGPNDEPIEKTVFEYSISELDVVNKEEKKVGEAVTANS